MSEIRVSHLLVKHAGSRRPSSWRDATITRSKTEAFALIDQYKQSIEKDPKGIAAALAQLATKNSDCSSASKGGDLGWAKKGSYQKPFEEAAYALKEGELSGPVDSDSGIHLIYRPVQ